MPNIYFLVEGSRTEMKIYPEWIPALAPSMTRVKALNQISDNNFYMFSGHGYPSLLDNHLVNSIKDVNNQGNINYLVICLDSEESTVQQRQNKVLDFLNKSDTKINKETQLVIIVQHRCIETWLLGNKKIFKRNPKSSFLLECINFYDVSLLDPELMGKTMDYETHAQFHEAYLSEIFEERNTSYTKNNPRNAAKKTYLEELIKRVQEDNHIVSFKIFLDFCLSL